MTVDVQQFSLRVPQSDLDTLTQRLREYRDEALFEAAGLGSVVPAAYVQDLLDYWCDSYNWRTYEARLNVYQHFRTAIAGQPVHFLHIPSSEADATPLLLTHAWPSSVIDVIDASARFEAKGEYHLVIPSIAWEALAGPAGGSGSPSRRTAAGWTELMNRLGYSSYLVADDRSGPGEPPAYTIAAGPEIVQTAPAGLYEEELRDVRWFNENLVAFTERQQIPALVLATAVLAWNAQQVNLDADRDSILTGVTLAWFAGRLAGVKDPLRPH
ncbi:epoxide hydrolase N-terminal domain-containing protein [Kribbella deserti]|uniref:Epoxide hydrolase N-terminal domain-containing protein n=1 Tax=Kribbella deserti TaxID=1926257 RepID=A0ABV6QIT0_9ACTN